MGMVDAAGPKKKSAGGVGVRKKSRVSMIIDMTPMVDIAFLLVIFFMTTTRFREPQAIEITLPKKGKPKKTKQSNVLVINLDSLGKLTHKIGDDELLPIKIDSLDTLLRRREHENIARLRGEDAAALYERMFWQYMKHPEKQGFTDTLLGIKDSLSKLTVLIQVDSTCYYKSVIEVMDVVNNARMSRFSVVRMGVIQQVEQPTPGEPGAPPSTPDAPPPDEEPPPTGLRRSDPAGGMTARAMPVPGAVLTLEEGRV